MAIIPISGQHPRSIVLAETCHPAAPPSTSYVSVGSLDGSMLACLVLVCCLDSVLFSFGLLLASGWSAWSVLASVVLACLLPVGWLVVRCRKRPLSYGRGTTT
jgi:hypothetical protein